MPAYKLIVAIPFGDYKRGDTITDQTIVNQILDESNAEMHGYDGNVRKIALTDEENAQLTKAPASDQSGKKNANSEGDK
jgi:hypothetical protein